jgi:hypothetical protein
MLTRAVPGVSALRAQPAADLPRGRPAAWFIIPPSGLRIRYADLMAEEVGLIPACGLHPCGAALSRSLCRCAAVELRFHPTLRFENPLRGFNGGGGGIRTLKKL